MGSGRDKKKKAKQRSHPEEVAKKESAAQKTARKELKKEAKKERRDEKKTKGGDDDIDALLAQMALEDKKRTAVSVEEGCAPPSPRCNTSVTAVELSAKRHELVIFGGEHYDGKKCRVYQDLYRYHIEKGVWYKVTSPGGPAARSAHVAGAYKSHVFVFGGEFTSPNQERFHHYKDLWRLDLETNKWEQIQVRGAPSPRSGHRAIVHKGKMVIFGGFYDNGKTVKYHGDTTVLDMVDLKWTSVGEPTAGGSAPCPRSAAGLAVHGDTLLLYGGYSKSKAEDELDAETGTAHTDLWQLPLSTLRWERLKRQGMAPGSRAGFSMATHLRRAVLFGGVMDREAKGGEVLISEFYNELYQLQLESKRWFPLALRRAKGGGKGKVGDEQAQAEEEEEERRARDEELAERALRREAARKAKLTPEDRAATLIQSRYRGHAVRKAYKTYRLGGAVSELLYAPASGERPPKDAPRPRGRINAQLAVTGNTLWVYGGIVEIGDKEITLDDLWSLDLKRPSWTCHLEPTAAEAAWEYSGDEWETDSDGSLEDDERALREKGKK